MQDAHASCDLQDITRARITQDIGVVAAINTSGVLLAISSGLCVEMIRMAKTKT